MFNNNNSWKIIEILTSSRFLSENFITPSHFFLGLKILMGLTIEVRMICTCTYTYIVKAEKISRKENVICYGFISGKQGVICMYVAVAEERIYYIYI